MRKRGPSKKKRGNLPPKPAGKKCHARNKAHTKYCGNPAGARTDHKGEGRCWLHGGGTPITSGRYSLIKRRAIRERLDALEKQDANPMDLEPDVALLRALIIDWVERYDAFTEALIAWHESFKSEEVATKPVRVLDIADASRLIDRASKVVERIHRMKTTGAISMETFARVHEQMAMVAGKYVKDVDTLRAIEEDWGAIRVDA